MEAKTTLLVKEFVTHDVRRFILEKPKDYEFNPGQATMLSIDKDEWEDEKRPFTFTSLNDDQILEFTIKCYPDHNGVTKEIHQLEPGDKLTLRDPFGTINYEGSGVFIAGGAGITPFIAIFRELREKGDLKGNKLIFSNKKQKDIILEKEFKDMLDSEDLILTLTRENKEGYLNKRIDKKFLEDHIDNFDQNFYICGPSEMVADLKKDLKELGAEVEGIIFEGK